MMVKTGEVVPVCWRCSSPPTGPTPGDHGISLAAAFTLRASQTKCLDRCRWLERRVNQRLTCTPYILLHINWFLCLLLKRYPQIWVRKCWLLPCGTKVFFRQKLVDILWLPDMNFWRSVSKVTSDRFCEVAEKIYFEVWRRLRPKDVCSFWSFEVNTVSPTTTMRMRKLLPWTWNYSFWSCVDWRKSHSSGFTWMQEPPRFYALHEHCTMIWLPSRLLHGAWQFLNYQLAALLWAVCLCFRTGRRYRHCLARRSGSVLLLLSKTS